MSLFSWVALGLLVGGPLAAMAYLGARSSVESHKRVRRALADAKLRAWEEGFDKGYRLAKTGAVPNGRVITLMKGVD